MADTAREQDQDVERSAPAAEPQKFGDRPMIPSTTPLFSYRSELPLISSIVLLQLQTGKGAPSPDYITWGFSRSSDGSVVIQFINRNAAFRALGDWQKFIGVVKKQAPAYWRSKKEIPELESNQEARELLRGCQDSYSYQLLLAAIDIVEFFRLMDDFSPDELIFEFRRRDHSIRSVFGPGRIYFVPSSLIECAPQDQLLELLRQNKLGEAKLTAGHEAVRYYLPYALPNFTDDVTEGAKQLWTTIRNEYYASQHPLSAHSE